MYVKLNGLFKQVKQKDLILKEKVCMCVCGVHALGVPYFQQLCKCLEDLINLTFDLGFQELQRMNRFVSMNNKI